MLYLVGINIEIVGFAYMTVRDLSVVLCRYMQVRLLNDRFSDYYGSDRLYITLHGEHNANDKSLVS